MKRPFVAFAACTAISLSISGIACGGGGTSEGSGGSTPPASTADAGPAPSYAITLLRETKLSKVFSSAADHYEASGVTVKDGALTIVFDNMTSVGVVNGKLTKGSLSDGEVVDSQYEGVSWSAGNPSHLFVAQETAGASDTRGKVVTLDGDGGLLTSAFTDVAFEDENKGFEGISALIVNGSEKLLALCEANLCGEKNAGAGNGRVKVLARKGDTWVTEATLAVPPQARFNDYADIALFAEADGSYRVAIVSQESSALWVGTLKTDPWELVAPGAIYSFPTTSEGAVQYCDVEGVAFLDRTTLAMVSDKTSGDGPCNEKDESAHVFSIP